MYLQIMIEFCAGGAVDAIMLGESPLATGWCWEGLGSSSWHLPSNAPPGVWQGPGWHGTALTNYFQKDMFL